MDFKAKYWLKFSLVNLLIVALLGTLMRYKIGFDFPCFTQMNILHSHSHFAFVGWITHTLYVLLVNFIYKKTTISNHKQYKILLASNLICAYGMLVSFFIQGYGAISILFTTLTIIISCCFAFYLFKDLNKIGRHPSIPWFKAALWFNILSSGGTFYLAYMMISKSFNEHGYLASVYFYLHFQYNGFFIFSCLALAINETIRILPAFKYDKWIFRLFFASAIPAYFLSVLWAKLPVWLYIIVLIAAFAQLIAWFKLLNDLRKGSTNNFKPDKFVIYLLLFVAIAFTIKLFLQLGSTIPRLSNFAFGFRQIVIAYLHLVLLAVISVFLLTYLYFSKLIRVNRWTLIALTVFIAGVFINELILAVQGIASFSYIAIPYINYALLGAAIILLLGALLLLISQGMKGEEAAI